jgi:hypothetical protein
MYGGGIGNDLLFHISRLDGLRAVWTNPINFVTFGGTGSGVNFFYPWLTYYPAIVIHFLIKNWVITMLVFFVLLTVLTFDIAYYYSGFILENKVQKYVFAVLYVFSTDRSITLFQRSAIGEVIAFAFLPMVIASFYKLITDDNKIYVLHLAVGMALIVYSHVLSVVICCFFLFLLFCLNLTKLINHKYRLYNLFKSIVFTLLLTTFFWGPLFEQGFFQKISRPYTPELFDGALSIKSFFLNIANNSFDPSLGIILFIGFVISCCAFRSMNLAIRQMFYLSLIGMFLSTQLFPWFALQNTPITIIQFPFRFLGITTVCVCFCIASLFKEPTKIPFLIACFLALCCVQITMTHNIKGNAVHLSNNQDYLLSTKSIKWQQDYYPKISTTSKNLSSIRNHIFYDRNGKKINVNSHSSATKEIFYLNTKSERYINTPFLYYKGVSASANGKKLEIRESNRGTVEVYFKEATSDEIIISSHYTLVAKVSIFISATTTLITFILFMKQRKSL